MEGDHGSIVAFRIPPRSAFTLPLRLPLQLLQPTCTPCNSPPPFVPCTILPRSLPPAAVISPVTLAALPRRTTLRLARSPQPSTLVVVVVVVVLAPSTCTRRYAGPDSPTRQRTLFSPLLSSPVLSSSLLLSFSLSFLGLFPPFFLSLFSVTFVYAQRLARSLACALCFVLSSSLFLSRSTSFSQPSRRRVKLAAQSRSVA